MSNKNNTRSIFIIFIFLIISMLLIPQVNAYRTFAANGDGEGVSDLKKATQTSYDRLNNEWQWTTGNCDPNTYQTHKDKDLTLEEAIKNIFGVYQSQIFIFCGHGNLKELGLQGNDYLHTSAFQEDTAEGNWGKCIPGSIFLFAACSCGKPDSDGLAWNALLAGARYSAGEYDKYKLLFAKEWSNDFAKFIIHDTGYTINQIDDKAFDDAYDDLSYLWILGADDPITNYYYWTEDSNGDYDTLNHIPRFEYDYDAGGIGIAKDTALTIGGYSGVTSDNGAILFLNTDIQDPDPPGPGGKIGSDIVFVEYRSTEGGSWMSACGYEVDKYTEHSGIDTDSEDIIYWFKDADVNAGFLEVRITPLEGGLTIHNYRLHFFAE